jgi:hypothetical protein
MLLLRCARARAPPPLACGAHQRSASSYLGWLHYCLARRCCCQRHFPRLMKATSLLMIIAAESMVAANYVIFSQRFSADPAPIVHDGRVYLYTSHDKDHPHGYDMQDWNCLSSSDMVNFRDEGIAFSLKNTTWCALFADQFYSVTTG